MAEDCTICTEVLGTRDRPAVQLTCGHVFCRECIEAWVRTNKRKDCPHCRTDINLSRSRSLWPWQRGLCLKEQTNREQETLKGLEETRAARNALETQAAKAERALRLRAASQAPAPAAACAVQPPPPPVKYPVEHVPVLAEQQPVLTEQQQNRAAANLAAALERKRKRESELASGLCTSSARQS